MEITFRHRARFDYDADIDACARAFISAAQQHIGRDCERVDAENSRRRSAAGGDDFPCALPDFCDANQVFLDGLDAFGFDFDGSPRCIEFVNAVWSRARSLGFWSRVESGNGPEKHESCTAARLARESTPRIEIEIKGGAVWEFRSSVPLPLYLIDHDCGELDKQNDQRDDGEPLSVVQINPSPLHVSPGSPALLDELLAALNKAVIRYEATLQSCPHRDEIREELIAARAAIAKATRQ